MSFSNTVSPQYQDWLMFLADLRTEVSAGHRVGTHQWNVPISYMLADKWLIVYFSMAIRFSEC